MEEGGGGVAPPDEAKSVDPVARKRPVKTAAPQPPLPHCLCLPDRLISALQRRTFAFLVALAVAIVPGQPTDGDPPLQHTRNLLSVLVFVDPSPPTLFHHL